GRHGLGDLPSKPGRLPPWTIHPGVASWKEVGGWCQPSYRCEGRPRSAARRDQTERDALRIAALDDPMASRPLHRAVEDRSAAGLDGPLRGIDRIDIEVV